MSVQDVRGGAPLRGTVRVPGDKSISHRALLLGALADGVSTVRGLSPGQDVASTRQAVIDLGADVAGDRIRGGALRAPRIALDAGNSGTTMRLLAGVCAGRPWRTELRGDASLSRRPMDRVALPLALMGADVRGQGEHCLPPLEIAGAELAGIDYPLPVASAQVKAAVLLAGLHADGETVVRERVRTRAHTEEMLARFGADVTTSADGLVTTVRRSTISPFELDVPGDPSQAAFWIVGAVVLPGSDLVVENVYVGPARSGFLDVLLRMGAPVEVQARADGSADIRARYGGLRATDIAPDEVPGLVDELPVLAVAAAHADGVTTVRGAGELRVKETDRIATLTSELTRLGAAIEPRDDGFVVRGGNAWRGAEVESHGDHRIAMALAVAARAIDGTTTIRDWDAVDVSYPGFGEELDGVRVIAIDGPVGAGKSTVARALAERLGLSHLDTGAMYRSVALAALDADVDPADAGAVAALAQTLDLRVGERVTLAGRDVTEAIRSVDVNRIVSLVAANAGVRAEMVRRQQAWIEAHGGGVVEGRDIGTVVFPDAELKVFLTASDDARAARREHDEDRVGLARRDHLDSNRAVSPLAVADDAVLIDSTARTVDQVVDAILERL